MSDDYTAYPVIYASAGASVPAGDSCSSLLRLAATGSCTPRSEREDSTT